MFIIIYLTIGLVIVIAGCFINKLVFNALIVYPITYILALSTYDISVDSYLDEVFPKYDYIGAVHWTECVCPKCGSICAPGDTRVSDKEEKIWKTNYVGTKTDKYTDGVNTIYVDTN